MEIYRKIKHWSFIAIGVLLFILIVLEWELDKSLITEYPNAFRGHRSFTINILLGILTGFIVSAVTSIIGFLGAKEHLLKNQFFFAIEVFNESFFIVNIKSNYIDYDTLIDLIEDFNYLSNLATTKKMELINLGIELYPDCDKTTKILDSISYEFKTVVESLTHEKSKYHSLKKESDPAKLNILFKQHKEKCLDLMDTCFANCKPSIADLNVFILEKRPELKKSSYDKKSTLGSHIDKVAPNSMKS